MTKALTSERWLPIPDWEGLYEVSDLGRVRSLDRTVNSKAGSVATKRGKVLRQGQSRVYRNVTLRDAKTSRNHTYLVSRLVLTSFVGPCPDGQEARHLNGNCLDNRLNNLAWGTKAENMQDRISHGNNPNLNKTHCPQGHGYTAENTYVWGGQRKCKKCRREIYLRWKERNQNG